MGGKSKSNQSSSSQNVNSNQGVNASTGLNYGINQSGNFGMNQGSSQNTGSSQSTGSSFNQSNQDVYGAQAPYLQDVYSQAQNAFQQGMGQIEGLTPEVQAQLTDAFGQAAGGFGDQLGGGFAAGLQGQVGDNAYVDAIAGDMMSDAQKIKQQNLGSLDARAAAAGMSGSSGYRDQVGDMMSNVDEQTMQGLTSFATTRSTKACRTT